MQRNKRHRTIALAFLLALVVIYNFSTAIWIYAKAQLAQKMIVTSWEQTLADHSNNPPWPWADTWPIARLQAPAHQQDLIVLASASGEALSFGPGHLLETALPGEAGTSVIAGHRDTHFYFLKDVKIGDLLRVQNKWGRWTNYRISQTEVVNSKTEPLEITDQNQTLILVTCYPFKSLNPGGDLRFIVTANREA